MEAQLRRWRDSREYHIWKARIGCSDESKVSSGCWKGKVSHGAAGGETGGKGEGADKSIRANATGLEAKLGGSCPEVCEVA